MEFPIVRDPGREGKGTMVPSSNGKLLRVRYRSHATHSRQPRQVRKEATVTSSGVCSGFPVPGFFVGAHSACVPETSATCVAERFYMFAARGLLGKQRPSDWGFECNRLVARVTRSDDVTKEETVAPRLFPQSPFPAQCRPRDLQTQERLLTKGTSCNGILAIRGCALTLRF